MLFNVIPRACAHCICNSLPPSNPIDNYMHLPFLKSFPVDLVITRYPKFFSIVPRILCAYCLAVLCHLNIPTDNSRSYRVSAHPQLFMCFTKFFEILSDLSRILISLWLLKCLSACILVNSKWLAIFMDVLCLYHPGSLDSICCECSQSSIGS